MPAKQRLRRNQRGMTLIELMMALTMLTIGMAGTMILVTTAIASNGRAKVDTTGTLLAQTVLDQLSAVPATSNITVPIVDCAGTSSNLTTAGSATGVGATLTSQNAIDYAQVFTAVPAGYAMTYTGCGTGGSRPVYQVRVHVRSLLIAGGTTYTKMIVVSTRRTGVTNNTSPRFFSVPVTLRTIVGS